MELAAFDTALTDGEGVTAEGVVCCSNANTLDVITIQPSSMLVVVKSVALMVCRLQAVIQSVSCF